MELDDSILAIVQVRKTATESIWTWHISQDEASVSLIEADRLPHAKAMEAIGLAGGEGRALSFRRSAGRWDYAGESYWIG